MNRDLALQVLSEVEAGRRVLVLCDRGNVRSTLDTVARLASADFITRMTHGREQIVHVKTPGHVVFRAMGAGSVRGYELDRVYAPHELSEIERHDLLPTLYVSGGDVVIWG